MNKKKKTNIEKLKTLVYESKEPIFTKRIVEEGISKNYIAKLLKEGYLERISHGVYISKDSLIDEMYYLQYKKKAIIFSHDTALYLNNLTNRDPITYSITVPTGYNTKNLLKEGLLVFSIKSEFYKIGLTALKTSFGKKIAVYNMERTICDMIRSRNRMDMSILIEALQNYVQHRDKNIPRLMEYAEVFRVLKLLRNYLSVLL
jgi:predicted transcriptional regulator of viral defense system